jgi:predicted ester cyclase
MSDEQNVAAFRRVMEEGFGRGNLDAVDEVVSPEFRENELGPGLDLGRTGLKQIILALRSAFPDLQATVVDVVGSGEKICFRVEYQGTQEGDMLGIPATGRRVTWQSIDIVRFDHDGTLLEHWGLLDRLGVLQQLGAVNL